MGRIKKLIKPEMDLDSLILTYAENKQILEDYRKICDEENKQIKELMDTGSYEVGDYKVTKSVSTKDSMNEDKLLETLKNCGVVTVIKTKEYVDIDALENAIYAGEISKEVLLEIDKCRETKEVVTLRISKVKEKNNNA